MKTHIYELRIMMVRAIVLLVFFQALLAGLLTSSILVGAETTTVVRSRDELSQAVINAADGDTIIVGNMNFYDMPAAQHNMDRRILIDKNITIKGEVKDTKLIGGSFDIGRDGTVLNLTVHFEDILFDGNIIPSTLLKEDWQSPIPANNYSDDPLKAQYAVSFHGNVNATFTDCIFTQYMYLNGAAFWGDYSELSANSACTLRLLLENCDFIDNSARSSGGAISLYGNFNISLMAVDCNFLRNTNCVFVEDMYMNYYSDGGGAIYVQRTKISLDNCDISNNMGNRLYKDKDGNQPWPSSDSSYGGGIYCYDSELIMTNCTITGNRAANAGGIYLNKTKADIDGCVIADNEASPFQEIINPGILSYRGLGGGIYIETLRAHPVKIVNTSIYDNTALHAYGGLHVVREYDEPSSGYGYVDIAFCTYAGNTHTFDDYDWEGYGEWWQKPPLNVWANPYVNAFGCVIVDDDFVSNFQEQIQDPTEDNDYNYFSTPLSAIADGILAARETENTTYAHIYPLSPRVIISPLFVKTIMDGRFAHYLGTFYVGDNYNKEVIVKFLADGVLLEEYAGTIYEKNMVLPSPTKKGYTFGGWVYESGEAIDNNFKLLIFGTDIENIELFALYTPNSYTATFMSRDTVIAIKTQEYDAQWILPAAPERNGYRFVGWYTGENGTGTKISATELYLTDGDIILYAHWEKPFPVFGIVLIIVGSVLVLATLIALIYIHRRKLHAFIPESSIEENLSHQQTSVRNYAEAIDDIAKKHGLTVREREITELLLQGKNQQAIADALFISDKTVKKHVQNIYEKLGVSSRFEMMAKFNEYYSNFR